MPAPRENQVAELEVPSPVFREMAVSYTHLYTASGYVRCDHVSARRQPAEGLKPLRDAQLLPDPSGRSCHQKMSIRDSSQSYKIGKPDEPVKVIGKCSAEKHGTKRCV